MFSMLVTLLTNRLCSALPWKNARLKCLGFLIVSILRNRTVNLVKLSAEAPKGLKAESLYRRFQNFFLHFKMPFDDIAQLVVSKLPKPKAGWVLALDRTNWKYGRVDINILVVAIVINKVAIPVFWRVLPRKTKRGNSNAKHRIDLLKRLLGVIPVSEIRVLTMDREFIAPPQSQQDRRADKQPLKKRIPISNHIDRMPDLIPENLHRDEITLCRYLSRMHQLSGRFVDRHDPLVLIEKGKAMMLWFQTVNFRESSSLRSRYRSRHPSALLLRKM